MSSLESESDKCQEEPENRDIFSGDLNISIILD